MKKRVIIGILTLGLIACTEKNPPDNGSGNTTPTDTTGVTPADTTIVTPTDTTIVTSDTIRLTWSGADAAVEGTNTGVSVKSESGYVTVNSTVKDITYILSGNGQGQLTIYGTNRHQLILRDLTLACEDGPAINNQCKKSCFVVLEGTSSLTDGASYVTTEEDRKAAFFSEGQMIFSGGGSLAVTGRYKHAIASDDYIQFAESTGCLTLTAASDGIHANDGIYFDGGTFDITAGSDGVQCDSMIVFNAGTLNVTAEADGIQSDTASIFINGGSITVTKAGDKGITAFGNVTVTDGIVRITSEYKCIKAGKKENNTIISAGSITVSGGDIRCICTGTSSGSGGGPGGGGPGGGWPGGGGWDSDDSSSSPEGIEAKGTITISGGTVYSQSSDDAINAGSDLTISGGCVCAYSTGNDGIDANGNCYIKGGVVYAIGASSPEVAIDANSEERKNLYIEGGIIVAVGKLESGAQLTQTCYQATGAKSTWYALTVGEEVFAFKSPDKNYSTLIVSGPSKPTLTKGVTASGTAVFNDMGYYPADFSGGSDVSLSSYSGSGRW